LATGKSRSPIFKSAVVALWRITRPALPRAPPYRHRLTCSAQLRSQVRNRVVHPGQFDWTFSASSESVLHRAQSSTAPAICHRLQQCDQSRLASPAAPCSARCISKQRGLLQRRAEQHLAGQKHTRKSGDSETASSRPSAQRVQMLRTCAACGLQIPGERSTSSSHPAWSRTHRAGSLRPHDAPPIRRLLRSGRIAPSSPSHTAPPLESVLHMPAKLDTLAELHLHPSCRALLAPQRSTNFVVSLAQVCMRR